MRKNVFNFQPNINMGGRNMSRRGLGLLSLLLVALLTMAACSSDKTDVSQEKEKEKEITEQTLKVAMQGIPPALDTHITGSYMTMEIARPVYEPLVAFNSKFEPQPMLAEKWEVSDDQKTYTFHLRQGIKFHNGKEMKAEDVVASMTRWKKLNATAERILGPGTFEAKDDYTIVFTLEKPSFLTLNILSSPAQFPGIMPKEIVEGAGEGAVTEFIGTGPYKVKEYVSDQFVHLEKFADYQAREEAADGLAGKKEALINEIKLDFVGDASTRVSSVITGEYHIVKSLPFDNFDQLDGDENVTTYTHEAGADFIVFNKKQGIFSNQKARQAILAGLDLNALSIGIYSEERFFDLNHSLSIPEQVNWYSDAGKELYNQNNQEKAKELLAEAGYNGEKITIVASNIESHRFTGIGLQQQLEGLGMNVELETYEFATLLEYRNDPSNWDLYIVDLATEPVPTNYLFFNPSWAGWTDSPEIQEILAGIQNAKDQQEATKLAEELQSAFYDYVPVIKPSNRQVFNATTSNVSGYQFFNSGLIPWNISLK